jgi:hypothetical protein
LHRATGGSERPKASDIHKEEASCEQARENARTGEREQHRLRGDDRKRSEERRGHTAGKWEKPEIISAISATTTNSYPPREIRARKPEIVETNGKKGNQHEALEAQPVSRFPVAINTTSHHGHGSLAISD